ncbi:MAG TPA: response regulator transcription factor [Acidimicrobiales bacterium]|jgi:two-component system KDP operon response regulator KdpE|nr:response regulator transcription factor [Acidimicrobiales bacterium]
MSRLLVIDDEAAILRSLTIGLRARGYELDTARTGEEGLSRAALAPPDVVILDLGLPDLDGVEVCRRIRGFSEAPIIVLSAHGAETTKVLALDSGADDFVTKPFGMAELEARLRVALRRRGSPGGEPEAAVLAVGSLHLDLARRRVQVGDRPIDLTAREFDLLAYLARHTGKVLTHRLLLEEVWGPGYGTEVHYLWVYANRLRRKLGDEEGRVLRTTPGVGYQLVADPDP